MNIPHVIGSIRRNNAVVVKTAQKGVYVSVAICRAEADGCSRCSLCKNEEKKMTLFCPVPHPEHFLKDDCVQVRYFSCNELFAAGFVFCMPVACSVATYAVWTALSKTGTESGGAVLASTAALAAGFMIIYIFERLIQFFYPVTIETVLKKNERCTTFTR